jgi:hypothetical protein
MAGTWLGLIRSGRQLNYAACLCVNALSNSRREATAAARSRRRTRRVKPSARGSSSPIRARSTASTTTTTRRYDKAAADLASKRTMGFFEQNLRD